MTVPGFDAADFFSRSFSACRIQAAMHLRATIAVLTLASLSAAAADWPQFLGPTRNAAYAGPEVAEPWPKEGPPMAWQKKLGTGWAGPVAAGGKVIVFHRIANEELVECLDAKSGRELWKQAFPTHYTDRFGFDNGPRSTPCIADGRVFTFGADGNVHALDFGDYAMAVSLLKRALSQLNGCLALLGEEAVAPLPEVRAWRTEAMRRCFDLREIWLRVIAECRDELSRPLDDES
ncbi:MAG: hypothetical protein EBU54_16360 [Mycobacteriaceae bacterium]|nr:hypothetical protein [Mycobacteriaceae bacterium]